MVSEGIRIELQVDHESPSWWYIARAVLRDRTVKEIRKNCGPGGVDDLLLSLARWLKNLGYSIPTIYWQEQFVGNDPHWEERPFPKGDD